MRGPDKPDSHDVGRLGPERLVMHSWRGTNGLDGRPQRPASNDKSFGRAPGEKARLPPIVRQLAGSRNGKKSRARLFRWLLEQKICPHSAKKPCGAHQNRWRIPRAT